MCVCWGGGQGLSYGPGRKNNPNAPSNMPYNVTKREFVRRPGDLATRKKSAKETPSGEVKLITEWLNLVCAFELYLVGRVE